MEILEVKNLTKVYGAGEFRLCVKEKRRWF